MGVLEKLIVAQLINKFPTFYVTRKFIAVFTKQPATGPCPEVIESSSHSHNLFVSDKV
jgi:hypothetical protein